MWAYCPLFGLDHENNAVLPEIRARSIDAEAAGVMTNMRHCKCRISFSATLPTMRRVLAVRP